MARINFLVSQPHYLDHMLPVYLALPEKFRGEFHVGEYPADPAALTVVSSWGDYLKTTGPVVFFEHGAGFTYKTDRLHPSYAGGPGRERVVLFCNVNEYVDAPNRAAYPDTPNVIIGSPKLDALSERSWSMPARPTVAFSFHWECKVAPETRSAFAHFQSYFGAIRNIRGRSTLRWDMAGHGHPLAWPQLRKQWEKCGITELRQFNDVVNLADVYVCDTSSTIYEWAALNRPVVVLNAPWYRRNVNHGIRFWDNIPGIQVDHPTALNAAIEQACFADTWAAERERITALIYPHLGDSSRRAAEAIVQLLS